MAKIEDIILKGTRGAQPAPAATRAGMLYCVTDENYKLERSSGSAWEQYSPLGGGDVSGPAGATADRVAIFSGISGKVLKDGGYTIAQIIAAAVAAAPQGDVVGPASSVNLRVAVFDGTSGKAIKDGGKTIAELGGGGGGLYNGAVTIPPVLGDWTWVNQGTATAAQRGDAVSISAPANAATQMRALVKAAPATPYTVTALLSLHLPYTNYASAGLCFRQSADGKMADIALMYSSGYKISVRKWTDASTWSADYVAATAGMFNPLIWMRLVDDGANRVVFLSGDGYTWYQAHTIGRTDFLTANQIGFFCNSQNSASAAGVTLHSWVVS